MEFHNALLVIYPRLMSRPHSPLLTRLRRHRGLWVVAMAVMMIKLVAGTLCLADGPEKSVVAQTTITAAVANLAVDTAVSDATDVADACVLGEAGDCHCACAHTMPMPATAPLSLARIDPHFDSPAIHAGFAPASPGSLLRPPIA